ncbi:thiol-disulfide oxidoreductase DCC family protein, partial [Labilibacter marinus]|uniref:thiol-disulfide oxidoreductase DCC family protein n=1 Tax=Labilibacter marinus TaxID=1477105 RepID=UPI00117A50EA
MLNNFFVAHLLVLKAILLMYQNTAKTILFYDGDCGLCNRAVVFVLKHEQNPEIQFASLQSTFAKSLLQAKAPQLQNIDSIILYTDNQFLIKSKAVILLSKHLKK